MITKNNPTYTGNMAVQKFTIFMGRAAKLDRKNTWRPQESLFRRPKEQDKMKGGYCLCDGFFMRYGWSSKCFIHGLARQGHSLMPEVRNNKIAGCNSIPDTFWLAKWLTAHSLVCRCCSLSESDVSEFQVLPKRKLPHLSISNTSAEQVTARLYANTIPLIRSSSADHNRQKLS